MCKISVLMPVYNAEKYLAEAIDSIIKQTYTDWELILINDGSTDGSEKIIEHYQDPRIKYHKNEQNLGLIRTLNKGIDLCQGKYIARMDADDIAFPERLNQQVGLMDAKSELILCGTNAIVIDEKGNETGKIVNPSSDTLLQISLLFTNPFIHPSIMIRKEKLGVNRFEAEALHVEDFDFWIRLSSKGQLANVNQPLLKYRWHETNVSVKNAEFQEGMKDKIIRQQITAQLETKPSPRELKAHRLTFSLYKYGKKIKVSADRAEHVVKWFKKLSEQNRKLGRYPQTDFDAFLWSRWMVLCIALNKKSKIFYPSFIKKTPKTIIKTFKLALYLSRK